MVVHQRGSDFEGRSRITTWLFGICLRVMAAHRRRAWVRRERATEALPEGLAEGSPEASLEQARAQARLGRTEATRSRAEAFLRRWPRSLYAERVRRWLVPCPGHRLDATWMISSTRPSCSGQESVTLVRSAPAEVSCRRGSVAHRLHAAHPARRARRSAACSGRWSPRRRRTRW